MAKEIPECRTTPHVGHLETRHAALLKTVAGLVDRLETLQKDQRVYQSAIKKAEAWLTNAQKKLNEVGKVGRTVT